ncbi:13129_t:CDS:10, partial [Entrophospora sp. SA101]
IENSYSLQSENTEIDMNVFNNNDCFQETAQIAVSKFFGLMHMKHLIFDGRVNGVNEFKSCCVCVNNVARNLYVLPRSRKYDEEGNDTNTEVTMEDVHKEIESICLKHKIMSFTSKTVSRKYAFELPGIPSDSDYLKVKYSFGDQTLPNNLSGATFSHVFGTNTSALELFLIKRKIKGPCWLEIRNAIVQRKNFSWCKVELEVYNPKDINPFNDTIATSIPLKSPPLTVMSLILCTVMNYKTNVNEIVAFSCHVIPEDCPNSCLEIFWIDAYEASGKVYIFGKIFDGRVNGVNEFKSCCVCVNNVARNLYVLPRSRKYDEKGHDTDTEVTMEDVHKEIESICLKHKIMSFTSKTVSRKYAFELPGIPSDSDYLKVKYSFTDQTLPNNLSGATFSHVFGTNTSALELFLIKRKIKGPCWLEIRNAIVQKKNFSWCKVELEVYNPKDINPSNDTTATSPSPPLTVMSLILRTVMNYKKNVNEIVAFSCRVIPEANPEAFQFTAIRQLNDKKWWPIGFEDLINKSNVNLRLEKNEYALLNYLIALIKKHDPDIFVGHNFMGFDLDILLHRINTLKIRDWSCFGRLRRTIWPKMKSGTGGIGESTYVEKIIVSGRLLCDIFTNAKDLVKSKDYSLTELAKAHLNYNRKDIQLDKIESCFASCRDLYELVLHCQFDSVLSARLMYELQILLLTKQLTSLAGNLWPKTLTGGRAERNEYLLLHEFHRLKYIYPDKDSNKQRSYNNIVEPEDNDEKVEIKKPGRRKPAYSGGLVLEPQKGFYDKYIVLLDFNSLYPSIIQEFNICFTTVDRTNLEGEEELPNVPDSTLEEGILPKLIRILVDRRKCVKGLMTKSKTSVEHAQLDIRQKALKLTANSMYGCLGFTNSRFYAKPLAVLITSKGREILQDTVDLAEKESMEVIYGDTDSIMINTNTSEMQKALEVGKFLKEKVNKRYKLLEIDIDGFFERLLLLKKKKYAAVVVEKKNGTLVRHNEFKGLDLVRRDWCELVHDASNYVLSQILSSSDQDTVLKNIHQFLTQLGENTRQEKFSLDKYIIKKNLTKSPEAYSDIKSQPHVKVALRMKQKGASAHQGNTIPYIICKKDGGDNSKNEHVSECAFHPDEIMWIFEKTNSSRISDCLAKFNESSNNNNNSTTFTKTKDQIVFKNVDRFLIKCYYCDNEDYYFEGINTNEGHQQINGNILCSSAACNKEIPLPSVATQLIIAFRKHISRYYNGWIICDEQTCKYRTKMIRANRSCIDNECYETMSEEYNDTMLYNQLLYYSYLFDYEKLKNLNPSLNFVS